MVVNETTRLCMCGCGQPAPIAARNRYARGERKGEPQQYVHGHNRRGHRGGDGRRIDHNGYVRARRDDGSWDYEHVIVAERALGRRLPPSARVHHVNGDRTDNRPANLVLCEDDAYHNLLHRRQRALMECGHAGYRKCTFCGAWDDPANMRINRRAYSAHHRECRSAYRRQRRAEGRAT